MTSSKHRVALIVGNGLSLDLVHAARPALDAWDTRSPLSWDLRGKENGAPVLHALPKLSAAIAEERAATPNATDFNLLERVLRRTKAERPADGPDEGWRSTAWELRHFLVWAYAAFQAAVDACFPARWRWVDWLAAHRQSLTMAVSLNYDLTLEAALEHARISYGRTAIPTERGALAVLKPHGSIDFTPDPGLVHSVDGARGAFVIFTGCDVPQAVLGRDEWAELRQEVSVVAPSETSVSTNYQWVRPGYERFRGLAPTWSHCVIVGVSYWECDRPELNRLLEAFRPGTTVIVVGPDPSKDLMMYLASRGLTVRTWWEKGPKAIPGLEELSSIQARGRVAV
jgi:hypothetical protein